MAEEVVDLELVVDGFRAWLLGEKRQEREIERERRVLGCCAWVRAMSERDGEGLDGFSVTRRENERGGGTALAEKKEK